MASKGAATDCKREERTPEDSGVVADVGMENGKTLFAYVQADTRSATRNAVYCCIHSCFSSMHTRSSNPKATFTCKLQSNNIYHDMKLTRSTCIRNMAAENWIITIWSSVTKLEKEPLVQSTKATWKRNGTWLSKILGKRIKRSSKRY